MIAFDLSKKRVRSHLKNVSIKSKVTVPAVIPWIKAWIGVKVLSEKTGSDENFLNAILDSELLPASIGNLPDELTGLLH